MYAPLAQVILNGCERLSSNSGTSLSQCSGQTITGTSDGSGVRPGPRIRSWLVNGQVRLFCSLSTDETQHVSGTHVTKRLHETVENNEERYDLGYLVVGQPNGQPEDQISAEAEHHRVAASKSVAEPCTNEDTRQGDGAQEELPLGRPPDASIVNDARDDGSGENTVRERDEVVKEPGTACANEGLPVTLQHQEIWHMR